MGTERTRFDDMLKERLHRDIIFRLIIGFSISIIATWFAISSKAIDPMAFMMITTDNVMRLLNSIGVLSLFLVVFALMFKDMEACDGQHWGQHTRRGYFGGIVRRLAGELTGWTMGGLLMILSCTLAAVIFTNIPLSVRAVFSVFVLVILSWLLITGLMNLLVRQDLPPPFFTKVQSSNKHLLGYVVITSFLSITTYFG